LAILPIQFAPKGLRDAMPNLVSLNTADVFFRVFRDRRGVTAIEYALIAALIAVAAIAAFSLVGTNLSNTFSRVAACL
jgi:pilus assembly protein Flp/PilA